MLVQVSKLAGLRRPASGFLLSGQCTLHQVELCIAFDLRLPIGGLQSVTVWHCLSLLNRVMTVKAHGLILLA